jgi:hypothetical protein
MSRAIRHAFVTAWHAAQMVGNLEITPCVTARGEDKTTYGITMALPNPLAWKRGISPFRALV